MTSPESISATDQPDATGDPSRFALAAFMAGAGVLHFVVPKFYEKIVPTWIGHEKAVVQWSGVAELLCAALIAVPRSRRLGAWATAVLLVVVFPANIKMALDTGAPTNLATAGPWLRLPLQYPMIRWALRHTR